MSVPRREKVSMEECRRRVRMDFEEEMGITDVLESDPNEAMLQLVADARHALEPIIERNTEQLFMWINR